MTHRFHCSKHGEFTVTMPDEVPCPALATCRQCNTLSVEYRPNRVPRLDDVKTFECFCRRGFIGPCPTCCNGAVLLNDTNDPEKAEFGVCPTCKGDSRQ